MTSKGFIFDLDGVIVDTAKYHFMAWKRLAELLGIGFSNELIEQFKGVSRVRCLEILLLNSNYEFTSYEFEKWLVEKNKIYLELISRVDETVILPGVMNVMNFLRSESIPMAIGSASKNAKRILSQVGIDTFFDAIVDGNVVSEAKPDPEVFRIAAEQIRMDSKDCIVFEDSMAGIEAANRAGMTSIAIGKSNKLSKAHYRFNDFTEIQINFINQLIQKI
ncbi:beta-phosphoglucomutase [Muricauda sp. ANG21]|uniref:beta-phosphoglucomutase n=1 Tax=Allomuricauda sp. ANG21 TaxID=3042468 RepID=UPI00345724F1